MEPGGHNSAKAATPELSAIGMDQPPGLAGIKKPYKKGDALSIINTAHSCFKSAAERLTAYQYFYFFLLIFPKSGGAHFFPLIFEGGPWRLIG